MKEKSFFFLSSGSKFGEAKFTNNRTNKQNYLRFFCKKLWRLQKKHYLCTRISKKRGAKTRLWGMV